MLFTNFINSKRSKVMQIGFPILKNNVFKKALIVMKLSIILLLAACLQVSATGNAQSISLSVKDAGMESVIKSIRKQSGYDFVYTLEALKKAGPISVRMKNATLEEALDKCFMDQPLLYTIIENVVVVKGKELPVTTASIKEIALANVSS